MPIEDLVGINARIMCEYYYFTYYKKYRPIGHKNFEKKYLNYFIKAAEMFCVREGFQPRGFIDSVLVEGFIYPTQIPVEKNWKTFVRNSLEYGEKEVEKKKEPIIELAHRVIDVFDYLHGRTIQQMTDSVLLKQDFLTDYDNDNLDLCVYCFSKSFKEFAEREGMLIDFSEEQNKIKKYQKIVDKIKEKLGDDFMEV